MSMKIKIAFFIALYSVSSSVIGQFVVSISPSKVNTCKDTVITFIAVAKTGVTPVSDATFKWSFGDGSSTISGYMLDTVTHAFKSRGGYIVRVDATSGTNTDYSLQNIQIGIKPDFTGTISDRKAPICPGQQVFLTGKYKISNWLYNVPDTVITATPAMISNTNQYKADFDYRIFNKTDKILNASNISLVGLKMEHSNSSNLKIELKCPNGSSIVLKDFDSQDKYFGIPIDNEGSNLAGTGYQYSWTNSPAYGKMSSVIPSGTTFLAGTYAPEQAFSGLVGCPLNGIWEIIVTDNQNLDNGYVFAAQMQFDPTILPAKWEYNNTYTNPLWIGNGVSSTNGSGVAFANPVAYGNNSYKFRVKDNYSCYQDTSISAIVEAATFTTDPATPTGDFPLVITFTNKTSWATKFEWDFGDGSEKISNENPIYTYRKNGNFVAKLVAGTNDGYTDTAKVIVIVTVPNSVFADKLPSVFSPNGDGQNEVFFLSNNSLKGIATLDCWIYSRWGKKVAEWHSVDEAIKGWDGKIKGGPEASPGVYYYQIKAVGYDSKVYETNGAFQLFR
jgi:gliding motility-associated-like protein